MKEITLSKKMYHYGIRIWLLIFLLTVDVSAISKLHLLERASNTLTITTFIVLCAICICWVFIFVGSKRTVVYNLQHKEIIARNSNRDRINGQKVTCGVNDIIDYKVITVAKYIEKYRQDLTYDLQTKEGNELDSYVGILELKGEKVIVIIEGSKMVVTNTLNKVKELLKKS